MRPVEGFAGTRDKQAKKTGRPGKNGTPVNPVHTFGSYLLSAPLVRHADLSTSAEGHRIGDQRRPMEKDFFTTYS